MVTRHHPAPPPRDKAPQIVSHNEISIATALLFRRSWRLPRGRRSRRRLHCRRWFPHLHERRGQCTRAKNRREVLGLLLALDRIARFAERNADALAQLRFDDGSRRDSSIQQNGHLAADVFGREALENARAFTVEGDVHLGLAGLLIPPDVGICNLIAAQARAADEQHGLPFW